MVRVILVDPQFRASGGVGPIPSSRHLPVYRHTTFNLTMSEQATELYAVADCMS